MEDELREKGLTRVQTEQLEEFVMGLKDEPSYDRVLTKL